MGGHDKATAVEKEGKGSETHRDLGLTNTLGAVRVGKGEEGVKDDI